MRHLDYTEIVTIQTLRGENKSQAYIASKVGKHQSTLSRFYKEYPESMLPKDIEEVRKITRTEANHQIHPPRILPGSHLEKYMLSRLTGTTEKPRRDSPDQIAGRWKMEQGEKLSKDTIYRYLKQYYPDLIYNLRRGGKKY